MMKNIFNIITVVSVLNIIKCCQSRSVEISPQSLPIPLPKYLDVQDPAHIIVKWDPVHGSQDNPILGFKVKLWEDQKELVTKHVNKDGQLVEVKEWVPVKQSSDTIPTHKPAFEAVIPPDVFQASFDVKLGEQYDLRAQSYNAAGDGPLSTSYGFKIHTTEETERIERDRREKEHEELERKEKQKNVDQEHRDEMLEVQVRKQQENKNNTRKVQEPKQPEPESLKEQRVEDQVPEEKENRNKKEDHHSTYEAATKHTPPPFKIKPESENRFTVVILDTNIYDYIEYLKSQHNGEEYE